MGKSQRTYPHPKGKLANPLLFLRFRPRGRSGRRIQRIFKKKADAVAFERYVLSHMHDKEWLEKPTEQRHLSDLLPLWWELGGRNKPYANGVLTRLKKIIKEMNDPRVSQINARFMAAYRSSRLSLEECLHSWQMPGNFTEKIRSAPSPL